MFDRFKFKTEEVNIPGTEKKVKFHHPLDLDNIEVKKLEIDEAEEATKVMKKAGFDVIVDEVRAIINFGMSFGAYDNRMLIGVGLGWPANYDPKEKEIAEDNEEPNAIYQEDPGVLLLYEGRGIRRILLKEREREGRKRGFEYSVALLSEELPGGDIMKYIREAGSVLDKLYLSEGYSFYKTNKGILVVKELKEEQGERED